MQDLVNLVLQPKQQQSFHCFPFTALLLTLPRWADADYENLWEQEITQCEVRAWRFNFTGHSVRHSGKGCVPMFSPVGPVSWWSKRRVKSVHALFVCGLSFLLEFGVKDCLWKGTCPAVCWHWANRFNIGSVHLNRWDYKLHESNILRNLVEVLGIFLRVITHCVIKQHESH